MKYFEKLKYLIETEGVKTRSGDTELAFQTLDSIIRLRLGRGFIELKLTWKKNEVQELLLTEYDELYSFLFAHITECREYLETIFRIIVDEWEEETFVRDATLTAKDVRDYAPEVRL